MATKRTIRATQAENDTRVPPPIICARCGQPIVARQRVDPLFAAKLVTWAEHPVLSKPVTIRGQIFVNGPPARTDLSIAEQLRQRAAMGGEKERAELAAFEALFTKALAEALITDLRKNPPTDY